jgi:transcriptional regulator with XRE-family HTH domain
MVLKCRINRNWDVYARELGLNIHKARVERGLSQEATAAAAGISTFTYQKLESGQSNPGTPANPKLRTLVGLSDALDMDVRQMLPE